MKKLDESLFEFAEQPLKDELVKFLDIPMKSYKDEAHEISYYDVGSSDKVLMLIPSSNGSAVIFFKYIMALSDKYRVIVPNYHAGVDLNTQALGFLKLAESLEPNEFYIFGYSFGGIIGQLMVKLAPEKIQGISFFDSESKTRYIHPKLVKRFVKSYKRLNRTLKYLPERWMHRSLGNRIAFDVKIGLEEDKHFWEALYKQNLHETNRDRMRMIYDNVREFWMYYEMTPEDFQAYTGKVMILNVEGSVERIEVKELSEVFKGAEVIVYDESFRMALVTCFDRVVSDIIKMIES